MKLQGDFAQVFRWAVWGLTTGCFPDNIFPSMNAVFGGYVGPSRPRYLMSRLGARVALDR
jgi:hypothetical protein